MSLQSSRITNTVTFHVPHSVQQLVHQLHISHGIFQIHLHISFAINCIICIWVFYAAFAPTLIKYSNKISVSVAASFAVSVSVLSVVPRVVFPHLLAATDCNTLPSAVLLFSICIFLVVVFAAAKDVRLTLLLWGLYTANYTAQQNVGSTIKIIKTSAYMQLLYGKLEF